MKRMLESETFRTIIVNRSKQFHFSKHFHYTIFYRAPRDITSSKPPAQFSPSNQLQSLSQQIAICPPPIPLPPPQKSTSVHYKDLKIAPFRGFRIVAFPRRSIFSSTFVWHRPWVDHLYRCCCYVVADSHRIRKTRNGNCFSRQMQSTSSVKHHRRKKWIRVKTVSFWWFPKA